MTATTTDMTATTTVPPAAGFDATSPKSRTRRQPATQMKGNAMATIIQPKEKPKHASNDDRVQEAIQRRIDGCSYRFVFSQVTWSYEDHRLTLHGCVPSFYLKQVLQELVRGIDEIEQINNHVDVVSATGLSSEPCRQPR